MGAFIDDRNLRIQDVAELKSILEKVCEFDKVAGHRTNLSKIAVFFLVTVLSLGSNSNSSRSTAPRRSRPWTSAWSADEENAQGDQLDDEPED